MKKTKVRWPVALGLVAASVTACGADQLVGQGSGSRALGSDGDAGDDPIDVASNEEAP